MYPSIYATYPILEKVGYFKAMKLRNKVQTMKSTKKGQKGNMEKNTVAIAEVQPEVVSSDTSVSSNDENKSNNKGRKPVWRTQDKVTPIEEMDDRFLKTAYFHSLKKIGEHSVHLRIHENSLNTFRELNKHLLDEASKRNLDWALVLEPKAE